MKIALYFFFIILIGTGCSHYSNLSKYSKVDNFDGYPRTYNEKLHISNLNYGDVKFAFSDKEFKKLNPTKKPAFTHILLYGQTYIEPLYDYYILEAANQEKHPDYLFYKYSFQEKKFILAVSKTAPQTDLEFVVANFKEYLK